MYNDYNSPHLCNNLHQIDRIQPPTNAEIYYRVIPLADNLPGKPSAPIVVTPIQLIAPIVESIQWLQ